MTSDIWADWIFNMKNGLILFCLLIGFSQKLLAQDSLSNVTYYSITDGWKIGIAPTALIAFKPILLWSAAYGWGNQFEANIDLGYSRWGNSEYTTNKTIFKPTLKVFPWKGVFFLGSGFVLDIYSKKEERFFLVDNGNYQQKFDFKYQEVFLGVPFYAGIQDEMYKGFLGEISFGFSLGKMDVNYYKLPKDARLILDNCFLCVNNYKSSGVRDFVKVFINAKVYFHLTNN